MCLLRASAIHFSHHDIDAAENYHHVSDGVAEAEVFQNRQVDETWRAHTITIRVGSAIADQIETEFSFRRFYSSVLFAHRRTKVAKLHFMIHNWTILNLLVSIIQNHYDIVQLKY